MAQGDPRDRCGADEFEWVPVNGGLGQMASEGKRPVSLRFDGSEPGEQHGMYFGIRFRAVLPRDLADQHWLAHLLLAPIIGRREIFMSQEDQQIAPEVGQALDQSCGIAIRERRVQQFVETLVQASFAALAWRRCSIRK